MNRQHRLSAEILRHLVSLKRPHGSPSEGSVIPYLSAMLPGVPKWVDGAGNLHVDTRTNHRHRTLFVAHVDTVHGKDGPNDYREDAKGLHAMGAPLGADDAAGVSILAAMVGTVPGYFIFTRGEERGGIGAKYLADNHSDILSQFDRAVAFDRKGTSSVISHQWAGRCCSDGFSEALSDALNSTGLMYMPDDTGVYTDTAEFIDCIPECTNLSAGYYFEHSEKEWLDTSHHSALLDAALVIDWDSLPTLRPIGPDCGEIEYPRCHGPEDEAIRDAVFDAIDGRPRALKEFVAMAIFPEDSRQASRHIDMYYLSPAEVIDACDGNGDWQMVVDLIADISFVQH